MILVVTMADGHFPARTSIFSLLQKNVLDTRRWDVHE